MKRIYGNLPDPLRNAENKIVDSVTMWENERRAEILSLFEELVFGINSAGRPESLRFHAVSTAGWMEGAAVRKSVEIAFEGPGGMASFPATIFVPARSPKPVPVFLLINTGNVSHADPERATKTEYWPVEEIVSRGYAAAVFRAADVDPDEDDGFANGIHGVFDPPGTPRPANAWGSIAAWAWGASRVLDYLETDPDIDAGKTAIVGHSRGGKTALWAGATDRRFAMVVSNNSGCTGAAMSRGNTGERLVDINNVFPHWFNANYKKYNGKEDEMPFDQHMLLSLIAPRPLYVASATEDSWADPEGEFASLVLSESVYRLYGSGGLGTNSLPPADRPVHGDKMGYHLRTGRHTLTLYDWQQFMDFADRFL